MLMGNQFERAAALRLAAVFALVAPTLLACNGEVESGENIATQSQEVWGGTDDPNTLEANVVVSIGGCTATLITPRILITAAHCVTENDRPTAYFGNDYTAYSEQVGSVKVLTYPGYNRNVESAPHPAELDAALVFLERPVFNKGKIRRPTFQAPTNPNSIGVGISGWSKCGRDVDFTDNVNTKRQAAIWQNGVFQGPSGASPLNLERQNNSPGTLWYRGGDDVGICFGDSGGPLFISHPDGTREVIGLASLVWFYTDAPKYAVAAAWADITNPQIASWITSNVLDSANGGHSAAWLTAHGKTASTFWHGEADYTGACQTAQDPDCDYWYSSHDDQPTVYNPEQGGTTSPTPCGGLCGNPTTMTSQWYNSGSLGSNATCHESYQPMTGFQCGNMASGRTTKINGQTVTCGGNIPIPAKRNGGYCVQTSAGPYDWAYFATW
jgi:hypothetical protein